MTSPSRTVRDIFCIACAGRVEWLDPGQDHGGWWAHEHHPADGHDALPGLVQRDKGGMFYGVCESCGWTSHLVRSGTKAVVARRQHRADAHGTTSANGQAGT